MIDIDFPTLAVSSVLLLGVAAPFVSYTLKSKQAKKKFLGEFGQFAASLDLQSDIQEDWRQRYVLGLDKGKNTLLYFQNGEKPERLHIPLSEVSRAVIYQSHLNADQPGKPKTLDQLDLQLYFKSPTKKSLSLEIYRHENYSDQLGESVMAAKWAELINQSLSN
ncbi:hypothetical protein J0A68_13530 [Algoriphagus sp. H41]|uniref:Uncharacterized protein n=1 Tax=Algoriphagus oliviformis TaxID=2811231 RepID=A0ABS3C4R1_9BACT|nr:hypothetical protein [Algoriphagus oliviformis]MBN7811968.1 hypothetical protein [Algoriphagus oliviformis]